MALARSSSFGAVGRVGDTVPMSEMNTTPLIDVMLVLLIMFIITVPVQSHQVEMDLPGSPPPLSEIDPVKNDLRLAADGRLSWNGKAISDGQLTATLGEIARYSEQPEIHFRPHAAARYERVDVVLGIAARSGADRFGFAGNEQFHNAI
jgi:biopolymer transport protein ExbD